MRLAIFDGVASLEKEMVSRKLKSFLSSLDRNDLDVVLYGDEPFKGDLGLPISFRNKECFSQDFDSFSLLISLNSIEPLFLRAPFGQAKLFLWDQKILEPSKWGAFKYKYLVDAWLVSGKDELLFLKEKLGIPKEGLLSSEGDMSSWKEDLAYLWEEEFTLFREGRQLFFDKNYQGALALLGNVTSKQAMLLEGFALIKQEAWIQASKILQEAFLKQVYKSDAAFGIALCHLSTGNLEKGLKWLEKSIACFPDHVEANLGIDEIRLNLKNDSLADEKGHGKPGGGNKFLFELM